MRIDKFTQKGQEAILKAQNLAQEYSHPAIEPEHLLKALIGQEDGVIPSVLALFHRGLGSLRVETHQHRV